jgi:hypothetical protein
LNDVHEKKKHDIKQIHATYVACSVYFCFRSRAKPTTNNLSHLSSVIFRKIAYRYNNISLMPFMPEKLEIHEIFKIM